MELVHMGKIAVSHTAMPQQVNHNHQEILLEVQPHVLKMARDHVQALGADQTLEAHVDRHLIEAVHLPSLVDKGKMAAVARAKRASAETRNAEKEDGHEQRPQCSKTEGHLQEDDHRTYEKLMLTPQLTAVTRTTNQQSIDPLPHRLVHCVNSIDFGFVTREVLRILLRRSCCRIRFVALCRDCLCRKRLSALAVMRRLLTLLR